MSRDPVSDIRRWLAKMVADDARRKAAEAKATSGEWHIAPDAPETSHQAKVAASVFLGSIRIEWMHERRRNER